MLQNVKIVLVNTTHPGNIGATARAMKTMGLERLALVAPKRFPSAECTARAAGADDVLGRAGVFPDLREAIAECELVYASSARSRNLALPEMTPDVAAERLIAHAGAGAGAAIVFGCERDGLSNAQLDLCNAMIRIPANEAFSSLNVAAAVQIICYEINKNHLLQSGEPDERTRRGRLATVEEMERLYEHFGLTLTEIGYLDPARPRYLMRRIRRLLNRAQPDNNEYSILRGILAAIRRAQ